MSTNLEIVMDIDTLEIFDVINLDEKNHLDTGIDENLPEEKEISPYDELSRIWLGNGYYYKPSSLIWEAEKDGIVHELSPKNKHGTYLYHRHARDGTWGETDQLPEEFALVV
ncbi:hypothetical protein [Streptococcus agalactiae]|uniref:hypothetical protein n=1 Tax=Streptococcus agalactiae TaxID=1311 RepID=UPI0002B94A15|nr:hypothetical protein [Streptococcus agalactiae]EPT41096.1 hypothetical protein SAG0029_05470 [Streptococcus agalactiae FSL S3-501]